MLIHLTCVLTSWNIGPSNLVFPLKSQELSAFDSVKEDLLDFQSKSIVVVFFNLVTKSLFYHSARDLCTDVIYKVIMFSSIETMGKCRLPSKKGNKFIYEFICTKLHNQRTKTIFGFFIQSMIKKNEYHVFFVLIDTLKPHPEMLLDFLHDYVKIVASINRVLLCHTYHGS
jgi:hypothetical protein